MPSTPSGQVHKHACSLCAFRKIKCDKGEPCSSCNKTQSQCVYEAPASFRPRRRAADEDLLIRIAQYEDLMRKHNVDFSQHANVWVSSGPEFKRGQDDCHRRATSPPTADHLDPNHHSRSEATTNLELCFWSNLRPELKYPSIQSFARGDGESSHRASFLGCLFNSEQPELCELFPEPRRVFQLWQIFVENVNPFTKIIHVPSLQQRMMDASWDLSKASESLKALLFAIYTAAVGSMPSDECQACFGESKDTLVTRYRNATIKGLISVDFLTTRDLEVMQAFILYLLADSGSDLASTLTGAAIRLCQKMGMDRESNDPKISIFEKEMRIRLWWQLRALDYRSRNAYMLGAKSPPLFGLGSVRLPLNVNDADLHPRMSELPLEHNGATEMLCVLLKLEIFNHLRASATAAKVYGNIASGSMRSKKAMELESEVVNELEAKYEEKFFRKWDKHIPLHAQTRVIANLAIARMRFKIHHPRRRADVNDANFYMNPEENTVLFNSAVTALEMLHEASRTKSTSHMISHMSSGFQVNAYIYVLSDLRRRCSGDRVSLAWKLVECLYNDHPHLINDVNKTLSSALCNLTLEAWETRRKELVNGQGHPESDVTPQFIRLLLDKREKTITQGIETSIFSETYNCDGDRLVDNNALDWESWDDFLSL